jgi:hypothetical protein
MMGGLLGSSGNRGHESMSVTTDIGSWVGVEGGVTLLAVEGVGGRRRRRNGETGKAVVVVGTTLASVVAQADDETIIIGWRFLRGRWCLARSAVVDG